MSHNHLFQNLTDHDYQVHMEELALADARTGLLDFTLYTKKDYKVNWHHKLICDTIDDFLEDPNRRRLMVFVGPRRGKSELISRRLPAYYLGRNPDKKIIATSYGAELAQSLNRDVQRIIDTPEYHKVFPETTLSASNVRTTAKKNYVRTTDRFEIVGHEGYYRSAGVGGGITGMGFDLGLIDDPLKDAKEAQSPTRKKAIWEWYDTTFSTRGMPANKIIVILTRWATDDLAGLLLERAMANPKAPQWEILCFPEIYDPNHPYVHPDDPRKEGEVIWPEVFPEEEVLAKYEESDSKTWNSLFQQLPAPDDGIIFKAEWFKYYKELPDIEYKMLSVDCSFKQTSTSDYVAMGVWGVVGPNKYLLGFVKERLDFPSTIQKILQLLSEHKDVRKVLVEDKANGPAVIATLKQKISRVVGYSPKESKEARANAVAPQLEAGNVFLPDPYYGPNRTAMPWCVKGVDEFVNEICGFPFMPNDDCVDMMTQALLDIGEKTSWMDELLGKGKKDELPADIRKEQEFTNKLAETMGWNLGGSDLDRYGSLFKKPKGY
jgi:predicted phage terminase large subunit-like protein